MSAASDIDYNEQKFFGKLQRMALGVGEIQPVLKLYWICSIDPKLSPKLLEIIKKDFSFTSENLRHLKRMKKVKTPDGKDLLKVIVCPADEEQTGNENDLREKILESIGKENQIVLEKTWIPANKPFDKDINMEWSQKYWPLLWKGNPLLQDLKEIYRGLKISKIQRYINIICDLSTTKNPIVTIFVDPISDEIKATSIDHRDHNDPINHSVLDGISKIADTELCRRRNETKNDPAKNNYLCHNYHVYTTHEPCTMCSMALVHSRISQLIYLKPSTKTGGIGKDSGNKEMIHISCSLNWKFEAFQYIDESVASRIPEVDDNLYV